MSRDAIRQHYKICVQRLNAFMPKKVILWKKSTYNIMLFAPKTGRMQILNSYTINSALVLRMYLTPLPLPSPRLILYSIYKI